MSNLTPSTKLDMLKADLGFFDSSLPAVLGSYLEQLIATAEDHLRQDGIELDDASVSDSQLCAAYAAWLYRKRATGEGKPPMLQRMIRNRQVHLATREAAR